MIRLSSHQQLKASALHADAFLVYRTGESETYCGPLVNALGEVVPGRRAHVTKPNDMRARFLWAGPCPTGQEGCK